jgi:hypothetical protein
MVGAMLLSALAALGSAPKSTVGFEGNQLLCKRRSQIARSFHVSPMQFKVEPNIQNIQEVPLR